MKAFAYKVYGDASVAEVMTVPRPEVTLPTAMRIKVHACAFNPIDYKRREGKLKAVLIEKTWPITMGYDAAGVVDQVGDSVTKFKAGDQVYLNVGSKFPHLGSCAAYTLVEEDQVAFKPSNMSFEEAAACPLAAITALQMLRKAGVKQGDSVFINAGAGGVGHFAVQLAKALGASRVVATASAAKHALLKELGCDEVVDYRTQDYTQVYADRPFDIALDNTAEVSQLCKVVKEGGSIVSIVMGFADQVSAAVSEAKVNSSEMWLQSNSGDLEFLTSLIEAGKVRAVIEGNVFEGIDQAPAAMAAVEGGRTTGKVVVKIA